MPGMSWLIEPGVGLAYAQLHVQSRVFSEREGERPKPHRRCAEWKCARCCSMWPVHSNRSELFNQIWLFRFGRTAEERRNYLVVRKIIWMIIWLIIRMIIQVAVRLAILSTGKAVKMVFAHFSNTIFMSACALHTVQTPFLRVSRCRSSGITGLEDAWIVCVE